MHLERANIYLDYLSPPFLHLLFLLVSHFQIRTILSPYFLLLPQTIPYTNTDIIFCLGFLYIYTHTHAHRIRFREKKSRKKILLTLDVQLRVAILLSTCARNTWRYKTRAIEAPVCADTFRTLRPWSELVSRSKPSRALSHVNAWWCFASYLIDREILFLFFHIFPSSLTFFFFLILPEWENIFKIPGQPLVVSWLIFCAGTFAVMNGLQKNPSIGRLFVRRVVLKGALSLNNKFTRK